MAGQLLRTAHRYRRRLARGLAVAFVVMMAAVVLRGVPRTLDIDVELGPAHEQVVELRLAYLDHGGEELHGVALTFPAGAPGHVRHAVSLPAGEVSVLAEARHRDGRARTQRSEVHAPAEGTVLIRFDPESP